MLSQINYIDHTIFEWIQLNLRKDSLDFIFAVLRDKHFWFPLYVFLISYLFFFQKQGVLKILVFTILLISISDQLSSNYLKKWIKRPRPCQELYFKDRFEPVVGCSGGYSLPSSHASNHAALGLFLYLILGKITHPWRIGLLIWPLLIGFAQIYIGVHFPLDILSGWALGFGLGLIFYFGYCWKKK